MISYRTSKVFVPGGLPVLTYNPRKELKLEENIEKAKDNLCKLLIVTGATKSGKTVLVKSIFPKEKCVWFDGGSFSSEDDFWTDIITQLDGFPDISLTTENDSINRGRAKGKAELTLPIPFPGMPTIGGEAEYEHERKKSVSKTKSRKGSLKTIAIKLMEDKSTPLIIDDFHYIPREKQASIVRAIKSLIFEGLPVIFIAIPHRRFDAIKVEKEMTGRVENVTIPPWKNYELAKIASTGFPLLNLDVSVKFINRLVNQAISSPHLMQEFCKELCHLHGIEETSKEIVEINNETILPELFTKVASATGKVMFEKLSKGPRQRTDRMKRPTADGEQPDIYGLVLKALSNLKPGLDKVDYEELRKEIKEISIDKAPEAHEVSRVLEYMSKIASSDESSTPVLDYEKDDRILHITDPFFAYYLRWGTISN
ncbi:MAG: ATP-binding protein [Bacteroidales bacterium]|nr:ATP-binding protein [Bacteroidales bacterium]